MVSALLPLWGLNLYGEWLILSAIPLYLAVTDLGLFSAAVTDMTMAVGRDDRDHARDVFQAVSRGFAVVLAVAPILVTGLVLAVPIVSSLDFTELGESAAEVAIIALAVRTLLIVYTGLIYGGFACEGFYGLGTAWSAAIVFAEFATLVIVAALGSGPAEAAVAMLVCRIVGLVAMYAAMRRKAPWLRFGKPAGKPQIIRRLGGPGLASFGISMAYAANVQGMIVVVGAAASPAAAAVFATLRTLGRVVTQLLGSIAQIIAPELAKAFGADDTPLLRRLQRRASQIAIWSVTPVLVLLALFGGTIVRVWTQGEITGHDELLNLILAGSAINILWLTLASIIVWTNRHQRLALILTPASLLSLPLAYLFIDAWGLNGGAIVLILMELLMLCVVTPSALRAADDTLGGWAGAVFRPPTWALTVIRGRLARPSE
jgi:O-antigen/teichoic acid export membrane protein